jgi:hypothetical protein
MLESPAANSRGGFLTLGCRLDFSARSRSNREFYMSNWFILVLGSLATFRLSHLITNERGPGAIFERFRQALPGGRGSAKEWVNCIWCFSLTTSVLICLLFWAGGVRLDWSYWILYWLSFSSISLLVHKACK